jgi:hypothetical protein
MKRLLVAAIILLSQTALAAPKQSPLVGTWWMTDKGYKVNTCFTFSPDGSVTAQSYGLADDAHKAYISGGRETWHWSEIDANHIAVESAKDGKAIQEWEIRGTELKLALLPNKKITFVRDDKPLKDLKYCLWDKAGAICPNCHKATTVSTFLEQQEIVYHLDCHSFFLFRPRPHK